VKNRLGGKTPCISDFCTEAGRGYQLIFMDIAMPIMDGYTATRIIREFEKNFALNAGSTATDGQQQQ